MKKIFRPFLILSGIVSLLFAIPNHQGIDRTRALSSPLINQSIAEFIDTGKSIQSAERYLITFVADTKYYIIAPDPNTTSYKPILKEASSTADFSYDDTFDAIFNPSDSTCSFIDKNGKLLSAAGGELCLSNLDVNPNNQFYLPNSNHESLKNVSNGLSIAVSPPLSIMLIDENDASMAHNLNLHFFMYKKFETKSSISFSYTYDGHYIFNGVPDLSFGAKIPLTKYEELTSDESNKPIFGVVLTTEIIHGSSLDQLEEMLAVELIMEDVPFNKYKRYKNIICTPARVDFNGFEDKLGAYYQWGVTIQNYGQSQDMIFGECGISVFPYIIYKGKVAFATPRVHYTARDCVDLYLNDHPTFDEYKALLDGLNNYLMECYGSL